MATLTEGITEHRTTLSDTQTMFNEATLEPGSADDAELRKELDDLLAEFDAQGAEHAMPDAPVAAPVALKPATAGGIASAYGKIGLGVSKN
jgi:hypothetical protein